jgi:PKHD-type hydroxylase
MNIAWKLRVSHDIYKSYTVSNLFSFEELQKIKDIAINLNFEAAKVHVSTGESEKCDEKIRVCGVKWIDSSEESAWLFKRLVDVICKLNSEVFNLNLYGIEPLQYTIYDYKNNSFYKAHRDSKAATVSGMVRKLSFTVQLTDPSEYEGGELILDQGYKPYEASKQLGDVTFFVSNLIHEVMPITKGVRHSLVGWVSGPPLV